MNTALRNFTSPAALARFFLVAVLGLSLDLWSKSYSFQTMVKDIYPMNDGRIRVESKPPLKLIPGWLEIQVTANQGAVFGALQGGRILFICVSVLAILFLIYLFAASGSRRMYQVVLGMLLAGVIGNMYDRIALGFVRDMIHALPSRHWPEWVPQHLPLPPEIFPWIFNVADTLLCVGVGLMIVGSMIPAKFKGASPGTEPEPAKS